MNLDVILLAVVDGLSYAGLLFLVALGLTLIFGVMGILNVAHGSLYAYGGYPGALGDQARTSADAPPSGRVVRFSADRGRGAGLGS